MTASSVGELRTKVAAAGLHRQDAGPHFEAFDSDMTDREMVQWAFTLPGEAAYPAVTCRHVYKTAGGAWRMERDMRCDASRAACDALFIQFRDLDEQARQELQRGR